MNRMENCSNFHELFASISFPQMACTSKIVGKHGHLDEYVLQIHIISLFQLCGVFLSFAL